MARFAPACEGSRRAVRPIPASCGTGHSEYSPNPLPTPCPIWRLPSRFPCQANIGNGFFQVDPDPTGSNDCLKATAAQQSLQLRLGDDSNPQTQGFVQFGTRRFARQEKIGLSGNAAAHLGPQVQEPVLDLVPGPAQGTGDNEGATREGLLPIGLGTRSLPRTRASGCRRPGACG